MNIRHPQCILLGPLLLCLSVASFARGSPWPESDCALQVDTPEVKHLSCAFQLPEAPLGAPEVRNGDGRSEVDFLYLKGSLEETARTHGRLLAGKIAGGVTQFVAKSKAHLLASLSPAERGIYEALLGCFLANYRASAPGEFIALHRAMAEGMQEAGETAFDENALFEMSYSMELTALIATLRRQLEHEPLTAVGSLVAKCSVAPLPPLLHSLFARGDLFLPTNMPYSGCTGAYASGPTARSGSLIMARNVDSSALGFVERRPLVILHDPPEGLRYVGVATPGMHYSGGSSGFNEKGIGVTLHAIGSDDLRSRHFFRKGMTAFFLQDRVLAKASSIDEAFAFVQGAGRMSGWAMVVGDAKTGEIASIEWTAGRAVIARRVKDTTLAQTNQFLAPSMQDVYAPTSFNKTLESRARQTRVEALLAKGSGAIDASSLRALLGDDVDAFEGQRSFGRNVTKSITTFSHIMEPARQGGGGRFTLTLGDRLPVTRGRSLSFDVDFTAAREGRFPFRVDAPVDPFAPTRSAAAAWDASRGAYTQAYMAHRDGDDGTLSLVEALLTHADTLARKAGHVDFPYNFMRARVALRRATAQGVDDAEATAAFVRAEGIFTQLRAQSRAIGSKLHPYDVSLIRLWSARARQLALVHGGMRPAEALVDDAVQANMRAALTLHQQLQLAEPGDRNLEDLVGTYRDLWKARFLPFSAEDNRKAALDFVTVE